MSEDSEYPLISAPALDNTCVSHEPLKPIWSVINIFFQLKNLVTSLNINY
jgi:hypothetical protein